MNHKEMTFCVSTMETCEMSRKVIEWTRQQEQDGWTVQPRIKVDGEFYGVVWQCVHHKDGKHQRMEFTECIDMFGVTHWMN